MELKGVRFRYPTFGGQHGPDIFDIQGFPFAPGCCYSLRGSNMSGKSTLLRLMSGTIPALTGGVAAGSLLGPNHETRRLPVAGPTMRESGVATVHQGDPLFPHMSIWDNVRLTRPHGARLDPHGARLDQKAVKTKLELILERLSGDEPRRAENPLGTLSGGGQAVIRMLRAVGWGYSLLLLDEPTTYLDAGNRSLCFELLWDSWTRGATVVFVSHHEPDHAELREGAVSRGFRYHEIDLADKQLLDRSGEA